MIFANLKTKMCTVFAFVCTVLPFFCTVFPLNCKASGVWAGSRDENPCIGLKTALCSRILNEVLADGSVLFDGEPISFPTHIFVVIYFTS